MSTDSSGPAHPAAPAYPAPGPAHPAAPAHPARPAAQADGRPAAGPGGGAAGPGGGAAGPGGGAARRRRGVSRQSKIVLAGAAAALLAIAVITVLTTGSKAAPPRTLPHAKAFTLSMLGHPGEHVSLAAFAGRPLIINFFASWCTPCKRETPLLARFYASHGGRTLIVGIDANDAAGPAEKFVQAAGVTYPIGFDPFPSNTTTSYGVYALPQTFFLNAQHRIVKHVIGGVTLTDLNQGTALMDARS
jgi:cytochrome c biogenesis protein CcmG/thiol:disulfide interchange protein DsbE